MDRIIFIIVILNIQQKELCKMDILGIIILFCSLVIWNVRLYFLGIMENRTALKNVEFFLFCALDLLTIIALLTNWG